MRKNSSTRVTSLADVCYVTCSARPVTCSALGMECVECVGEKRSSHSLCRGNAEPLCRTRTGDISWMPVKASIVAWFTRFFLFYCFAQRLFVVLFVVLSCQTATSEASITCGKILLSTRAVVYFQQYCVSCVCALYPPHICPSRAFRGFP